MCQRSISETFNPKLFTRNHLKSVLSTLKFSLMICPKFVIMYWPVLESSHFLRPLFMICWRGRQRKISLNQEEEDREDDDKENDEGRIEEEEEDEINIHTLVDVSTKNTCSQSQTQQVRYYNEGDEEEDSQKNILMSDEGSKSSNIMSHDSSGKLCCSCIIIVESFFCLLHFLPRIFNFLYKFCTSIFSKCFTSILSWTKKW